MLSKRKTVVVPNMDLLNGNECTARLRKYGKKLVDPNMEEMNTYLKDGTKTKLLSKMGGQRSNPLNMTRLPWRTIHTSTRSERIQNTKHWVLRLNQDGA